MKWKQAIWFALALIALSGCSQQSMPTATVAAALLQPFSTRTPVIDSTATQPATLTPSPSPTPFIYEVARGDTLNLLAQRFGLSVDALQAANPDLSPQTLSIGKKINIPAVGQNFSTAPLETPVPLDLGAAHCKPTASDLFCIVPLHNPNPQAVENVNVQITLLDAAGQTLGSQEALLPLNILASGQVLPATASFPGVQGQSTIQVQLISAQLVPAKDDRYLKANFQNLVVKIAWDGLSANLRGQISLPADSKPASRVWVAAVAYDSNGQITGYRRWEAAETLQAGSSLPIELNVYSLGAEIDHVDVQIEAAQNQPGQ
jgi:murein DD-endopeptidase MepM/ murein hydrolase activator NlpD